jgi:hypothetical protein
MPDFANDPPVHATQRLLCSTEPASMFLRQFEVVTRIKTSNCGACSKASAARAKYASPSKALKSWLKKRELLLEAK